MSAFLDVSKTSEVRGLVDRPRVELLDPRALPRVVPRVDPRPLEVDVPRPPLDPLPRLALDGVKPESFCLLGAGIETGLGMSGSSSSLQRSIHCLSGSATLAASFLAWDRVGKFCFFRCVFGFVLWLGCLTCSSSSIIFLAWLTSLMFLASARARLGSIASAVTNARSMPSAFLSLSELSSPMNYAANSSTVSSEACV